MRLQSLSKKKERDLGKHHKNFTNKMVTWTPSLQQLLDFSLLKINFKSYKMIIPHVILVLRAVKPMLPKEITEIVNIVEKYNTEKHGY